MPINEGFHQVNLTNLEKVIQEIPEGDFASKSYDNPTGQSDSLKHLFIILSTQRSGSTYLCDILRQENICNAHEYFQPYQYLQYLAYRWNCIENGLINKSKYISQLVKHRVSSAGVLGVNLHGRHLNEFESFKKYFDSSLEFSYVFLRRQDEISQAISYEIADQTGKWSNFFSSSHKPIYDFSNILKKLDRIRTQNSIILAYLLKEKIKYTQIYYEDLILHDEITINEFKLSASKYKSKTIKKQSNSINVEWKERFAIDYYNYEFDEKNKSRSISKKIISKILGD